jgi:hypothetical protein
MSNPDEIQELSTLIKETGDQILMDYYLKFCELIRIEVPEDPFPLEMWTGIAQALADASGYRIVLQAGIMSGTRDTLRLVGYREVASVEPNLFITPAERE